MLLNTTIFLSLDSPFQYLCDHAPPPDAADMVLREELTVGHSDALDDLATGAA